MANLKINQIKLMAAICKEICDQQENKAVPASAELMNTCVEAANLVVAKLNGMEYEPVKPVKRIKLTKALQQRVSQANRVL